MSAGERVGNSNPEFGQDSDNFFAPRRDSISRRAVVLTRLLAVLTLGSSGCLAPIALDRAVMSYDTVADDTVSRQLLVNDRAPMAHGGAPGCAALSATSSGVVAE